MKVNKSLPTPRFEPATGV